MHVLIFGGRGYLAHKFHSLYPDAVLSVADIADPKAVAHALDDSRPDVVINCAGKTGSPNVDWCEDHKLETIRSNVTGPLVLLEECQKRGIYWVHLSSGCIYEGHPSTPLRTGKREEGKEGQEGWTEEDEPNFTGSFYSRTKAWSEKTLREFPVLILRLRMPFDGEPHPRNLISKLSTFERVLDVENSITCLGDFLWAAEALIAKRATGIFNVVNEGAISPYRIMELYREIVNPEQKFERLLLDALSQVIRGKRSNCILSTVKLRAAGIGLPPVESSARSALAEFKIFATGRPQSSSLSKECIQC